MGNPKRNYFRLEELSFADFASEEKAKVEAWIAANPRAAAAEAAVKAKATAVKAKVASWKAAHNFEELI